MAALGLLISPPVFLTGSLVLLPVSILGLYVTLCCWQKWLHFRNRITFCNWLLPNCLCHIVVFVHPSIHVCVTLIILGSMHRDSACEAVFSLRSFLWIFSLLFFTLERILAGGSSWKLSESRFDSWMLTFTAGVSSWAKGLNHSKARRPQNRRILLQISSKMPIKHPQKIRRWCNLLSPYYTLK